MNNKEEKNTQKKNKNEVINEEFVVSCFHWLDIDTQKKNANKFENITKKNDKSKEKNI